MHEIIQNNLLAVMSCLFMMFFLYKDNSFERMVKIFFWHAVIALLLLIIVDAWEKVEAARSYPTYARITASVLGYSIRPIIAYFAYRVAMRIRKIRFNYLFVIPLILNILIVSTAFFSPVAFSYDAANQFVRGPLGYITFIVGMFYAIGICHISISIISKGNREEAAIVLFVAIILVIATIVESLFHFDAILSGGGSLGLIFYYLYLNINVSEHDALTGIKTRRNFYNDSERNIGHLAAVISIDLNNLKILNDKYGHRAGDRALVKLTEVVKNILPAGWGFYRTGGDEFMILCYRADEALVQNFVNTFNDHMARSGYSAAIGYAMYERGMDFDKVCHSSDTMMYENKKLMKKKMKEHII